MQGYKRALHIEIGEFKLAAYTDQKLNADAVIREKYGEASTHNLCKAFLDCY